MHRRRAFEHSDGTTYFGVAACKMTDKVNAAIRGQGTSNVREEDTTAIGRTRHVQELSSDKDCVVDFITVVSDLEVVDWASGALQHGGMCSFRTASRLRMLLKGTDA